MRYEQIRSIRLQHFTILSAPSIWDIAWETVSADLLSQPDCSDVVQTRRRVFVYPNALRAILIISLVPLVSGAATAEPGRPRQEHPVHLWGDSPGWRKHFFIMPCLSIFHSFQFQSSLCHWCLSALDASKSFCMVHLLPNVVAFGLESCSPRSLASRHPALSRYALEASAKSANHSVAS